MKRNQIYYDKIETILRNNANYEEIQDIVYQFKYNDEKETRYKERKY